MTEKRILYVDAEAIEIGINERQQVFAKLGPGK